MAPGKTSRPKRSTSVSSFKISCQIQSQKEIWVYKESCFWLPDWNFPTGKILSVQTNYIQPEPKNTDGFSLNNPIKPSCHRHLWAARRAIVYSNASRECFLIWRCRKIECDRTRPQHWPRRAAVGAQYVVFHLYFSLLCCRLNVYKCERPLKWMERDVLIRRVRAADADATRLQTFPL